MSVLATTTTVHCPPCVAQCMADCYDTLLLLYDHLRGRLARGDVTESIHYYYMDIGLPHSTASVPPRVSHVVRHARDSLLMSMDDVTPATTICTIPVAFCVVGVPSAAAATSALCDQSCRTAPVLLYEDNVFAYCRDGSLYQLANRVGADTCIHDGSNSSEQRSFPLWATLPSVW